MTMIFVVSEAIQTALLTSTVQFEGENVSDLIDDLVDERIYNTLAAEGASLPYIVHQLVGGGDPSIAPGVVGDLMWQVKAISASPVTANLLASYCDAALHYANLTLLTGWNLSSIRHDAPFYFVEHENKRQYHHAGWTFRIRIWEDQ